MISRLTRSWATTVEMFSTPASRWVAAVSVGQQVRDFLGIWQDAHSWCPR